MHNMSIFFFLIRDHLDLKMPAIAITKTSFGTKQAIKMHTISNSTISSVTNPMKWLFFNLTLS